MDPRSQLAQLLTMAAMRGDQPWGAPPYWYQQPREPLPPEPVPPGWEWFGMQPQQQQQQQGGPPPILKMPGLGGNPTNRRNLPARTPEVIT